MGRAVGSGAVLFMVWRESRGRGCGERGRGDRAGGRGDG